MKAKKEVVNEEVNDIIAPVPAEEEEVPDPMIERNMCNDVERILDYAIAAVDCPNPNCDQSMIHNGVAALVLKCQRESERRGLVLTNISVRMNYIDSEGNPYTKGMSIRRCCEGD